MSCGRERPLALWPRLAAINSHFFFFFVGGVFSHLDPIASSVHLGSLRTSWLTHSTAPHNRRKHNLCSYTWVVRRERTQPRETEPAFLWWRSHDGPVRSSRTCTPWSNLIKWARLENTDGVPATKMMWTRLSLLVWRLTSRAYHKESELTHFSPPPVLKYPIFM